MVHSGLLECWWAEAIECYCYLRNVQDLQADDQTLYERRFNSPLEGPMIILFGSRSKILPICKRPRSSASVRHKGSSWNIHGIRLEHGEKLDWWSIDSECGRSQTPCGHLKFTYKDSDQKKWTISRETVNLYSMKNGRTVARRAAVFHRCVPSGRRPQARISSKTFRRRRSSRFWWSPTSFPEYYRWSLKISESCYSKDENPMFRRMVFRYLCITLMFRDKTETSIKRTSWGEHRCSWEHGRRSVTVWTVGRWDTIRVAQRKSTRRTCVCVFKADWQRNRLLQDLDIFGSRMSKESQRRAINKWAEAKFQLDAAREQRGIYFFGRWAWSWGNYEQRQKKLGDEESLSEALQSHHTSQPERFKLEATLCKWLVSNQNEKIEFFISKPDHQNIIIESQRNRSTKSQEKTHHIADRKQVSMSHFNTVHKPFSRSQNNGNPSSKRCNGSRLEWVENETILSLWYDDDQWNNSFCFSNTTSTQNPTYHTRLKCNNHIKHNIFRRTHFRIVFTIKTINTNGSRDLDFLQDWYEDEDFAGVVASSRYLTRFGEGPMGQSYAHFRHLRKQHLEFVRRAHRILHSYGWRLARAELRTDEHAPSTNEGNEDDFDYGALIDRVYQRDQVSQTSSTITAQAWSYGPTRSWGSGWQYCGWGHSQNLWLLKTEGSFTRTQMTLLVNIMTRTTLTQSNLTVSSVVVNPLFSGMSKRAGEYVATSASARQKPVIAQDWMREELAIRMLIWTITQYFHQNIKLEATPSVKRCVSARSWKSQQNHGRSIKLRATGCHSRSESSSSSKYWWRKYMRKFDDPAKNLKPQSEEEHEF